MTTAFKDEFIDRIKAEGRAEVLKPDFIDRIKAEGRAEGEAEGELRGRADMLVRVLAARGLEIPDPVRERVLSCTDLGQLDAWGDRAVTATSLGEVFPG